MQTKEQTKLRKHRLASFIKQTGRVEAIVRPALASQVYVPDADFCRIHGSLRNDPCPCEDTTRPSKTILRRQAIHFEVRGRDKNGNFHLNACGCYPDGLYTVEEQMIDEDGEPMFVTAGDRVIGPRMKTTYKHWPMMPFTSDVTLVSCGNCLTNLRAALKHHDKLEARNN